MKRYSLIVVAMLFISLNAFAFGYGYNPAQYRDAEMRMKQQQQALYKEAVLGQYVVQQLQAGNGNDSQVQALIASTAAANPAPTRNVPDKTRDYRRSANNAVEEQTLRYFQENPTIINEQLEQTFQIEGQQRVKEAKHQGKLAETRRQQESKMENDRLMSLYCQSLFQNSPQDQFKCAQHYMANSYTNGAGYRKYRRNSSIRSWFNPNEIFYGVTRD